LSASAQIVGTGHQDPTVRTQSPDHKPRVGQGSGPYGQIEALVHKIDEPVRKTEVYRQFGEGFEDVIDDRAQMPAAERDGSADPNRAAGPQRAGRRIRLRLRLLQALRIRLARARKAAPASVNDSRRVVRWISLTPSFSSSLAIRRETPEADMSWASAVPAKLSSLTTDVNTASSRVSMVMV